jgi:hypothetical protein
MKRLFTYSIPVDDGAAPNPFWGYCTLTICKPRIRSVAQEGDWVVGIGSIRRGFENYVVYAMKVTKVIPLPLYEDFVKQNCPEKIPDINHPDIRRRVGDCIYDYSSGTPKIRKSVHDESNRDTDLGGKNSLVSNDFYYFGNKPIPLPQKLLSITHPTQGHKSTANNPYVSEFETWIRGLPYTVGGLYGQPDYPIDWSKSSCGHCATRKTDGELDVEYKSLC